MAHSSIQKQGGTGFQSEYLLDGASAKSIWNQISTSRGLTEWFAPRVELYGDTIHVFWDEKGDDRKGNIIQSNALEHIKWTWEDDTESFISMRIVYTELSHTSSLIVEDRDLGITTQTLESLWEKHIEQLRITLGIG